MRSIIIVFFLFSFQLLSAQPGGSDEIYQIAEEMPRFPGCEDMEGGTAQKEACAKEQLLAFVYQNIVYPDSARINGNEGTVVVRFVVDKTGKIVNDTLLKDIGGGCGAEALRVVKLMNELTESWIPGKQGGKAVDVYYTLPVKFKIRQAVMDPDFVVLEGDSIWVKYDSLVSFRGGEASYENYMAENLEYPFIGNIDCEYGVMEIKILARADGSVKILDIIDYNNLSIHFWYNAIDFIHKSAGRWEPAILNGRKVNGTHNVRLTFLPTFKCKDLIENYNQATDLVSEALDLFDSEKVDQAIEKFTEAIELVPDNAEFLALRGQIFIEANRLDEACSDLKRVKELIYVDWYDQYFPLICNTKVEAPEETEGNK